MAKIKMVCNICGHEETWYESWWHEVMAYKTQHGKYICSYCYDIIAIEACEKYGRKKI